MVMFPIGAMLEPVYGTAHSSILRLPKVGPFSLAKDIYWKTENQRRNLRPNMW